MVFKDVIGRDDEYYANIYRPSETQLWYCDYYEFEELDDIFCQWQRGRGEMVAEDVGEYLEKLLLNSQNSAILDWLGGSKLQFLRGGLLQDTLSYWLDAYPSKNNGKPDPQVIRFLIIF